MAGLDPAIQKSGLATKREPSNLIATSLVACTL